jgi:hypothetical protein
VKKFWFALVISLYFYTRMDILIWQRIFEEHKLMALGIGVYHWGWLQSLFGFMALGSLLCYPYKRRMITFPLSLAILAFSGLEDVLYYWLDGKQIPAELPWLNINPLLLKPVTVDRLLLSAGFWLLFVIGLEIFGGALTRAVKKTSLRLRHAPAFHFAKARETASATSLPNPPRL